MAAVVYARRALEDLERLFGWLAEHDPDAAVRSAAVIRSAVAVLEDHPFIGRPIERGLRELVISFGRTGYVALYRVVPTEVRVLAIRHQRELERTP